MAGIVPASSAGLGSDHGETSCKRLKKPPRHAACNPARRRQRLQRDAGHGVRALDPSKQQLVSEATRRRIVEAAQDLGYRGVPSPVVFARAGLARSASSSPTSATRLSPPSSAASRTASSRGT